jgi:hypothetical protein
VYTMNMEKEPGTKVAKRRGPPKRGYKHAHLLLQPHIIEWASAYPDGMCAFIRIVLDEVYKREQGNAKPAPVGAARGDDE